MIDGVMWRGTAGRLSFAPEDGLEVVATGKLTTYPGRSKYQIVIEKLEVAGEGALLALLEKTRARLAAEGLFDESRKRALPFLPRLIGVVTSPTGAVIRDILHRLADRFPTPVIVWPVLVQGPGSAEQVAAAVRGFATLQGEKPDLLIVARGGGAIEDLWGFNEEAVVRAIVESPIPVISAVGHETDTTLADFAADRRAPTPTAAAEMAVPVRAELAAMLADLKARQQRAILRPVALGWERLEARVQRLPGAEALLTAPTQRLDDAAGCLRRALRDRARQGGEQLAALRLSPVTLERSLREARLRLAAAPAAAGIMQRRIARDAERFDSLVRVFQSLDPRAPLQRGYALVTNTAGAVIRTRKEAAGEARFDIAFGDGVLSATPAAKPSPAKRARKGSAQQDDLFS